MKDNLLLVLIVLCLISMLWYIVMSKIETNSQILCMKNHGAKLCGIKNPSIDAWSYCISYNLPKDCGEKPY